MVRHIFTNLPIDSRNEQQKSFSQFNLTFTFQFTAVTQLVIQETNSWKNSAEE
jgi:hypothetical protein